MKNSSSLAVQKLLLKLIPFQFCHHFYLKHFCLKGFWIASKIRRKLLTACTLWKRIPESYVLLALGKNLWDRKVKGANNLPFKPIIILSVSEEEFPFTKGRIYDYYGTTKENLFRKDSPDLQRSLKKKKFLPAKSNWCVKNVAILSYLNWRRI